MSMSMMMRRVGRTLAASLIASVLFILATVSSSSSSQAAAPGSAATTDPPVANERVILHTIAGDLVLTLYPTIAPRTVEQFLKLVRAGVYDTTAFVRVEPGFVVQLSSALDRSKPMSEEQKALIHRIPAEVSDRGGGDRAKHVRGVLSMAREDGDLNSAETSFSILLGAAPHLDGKYTVFGRIEDPDAADAVLEEMLRVPRGTALHPVVRIEVTSAEVVSPHELRARTLAPPRTIPIPRELVATRADAKGADAAAATTANGVGTTEIAFGLAFVCFVGLVSFFLQGKVPSSVHGSLNLVIVLVSAFVLLIVLLPRGQHHPWLATMLFAFVIALFKVLGRFEQARPPATAPAPAPSPAPAPTRERNENEK